jgi:hypothetical protein
VNSNCKSIGASFSRGGSVEDNRETASAGYNVSPEAPARRDLISKCEPRQQNANASDYDSLGRALVFGVSHACGPAIVHSARSEPVLADRNLLVSEVETNDGHKLVLDHAAFVEARQR